MACTSPLPAWRPAGSGGRPRIEKAGWTGLAAREASSDVETFRLDCGSCLSCRIAKQRDLAVRAVHQTVISGEENAWFATLTYNDAHLPHDCGLSKEDLRNFMKRFRKAHGSGIKVLGCGEYGDFGTRRAHYHLALWGHSFSDRTPWQPTPKGHMLYRSAALEAAWSCPKRNCSQPIGHCWLGNLTYESAAYVAGYTTKKIGGSQAFYAYLRYDKDGEMVSVQPEFHTVSRGGRNGKGLAYEFYERYFSDLFPKDYTHIPSRKAKNGMKQVPVPRYYRKLLEKDHPEMAALLKERRVVFAREMAEDTEELRIARDATVRAERRLYGHPEDEDHVDGAAEELLARHRRRVLPRGDYEALARDVAAQKG